VLFLKYIFITFPILLFLGTFSSCSKSELESEKIVAKVGDRVITADEFRYHYEFGFGAIKKGPNPRRIYLDYMIKELLLANEGYRLGLHQTTYVKNRVRRRKKNNMLEAYYLNHVHAKINIPEDKIQEAVKNSSVSFRIITWPTNSKEEAEQVQIESNKSSLSDYIDDQLAKQEVKITSRKSFETDWMDYLDLPPEVFKEIKDLEIGKTSNPFPLGNGWAVAQVLDINLHGIKQSDLIHGARRKNIEIRLYNVEYDSIMHALMDSVLTPLDLRVKSQVVDELAEPLFQWYKDGLPKNRSVFTKVENPADTAKAYITEIHQLLDKTLLTYSRGEKSVRDYLEYMDYYRKSLKESSSFETFNVTLIAEIGRMIKDETFLDLADQEGYADSVKVKRDVEIWEQKWTYDVYRSELLKDIDVSKPEMRNFFKTRYNELPVADVDTSRFKKYENLVYNTVLLEKHLAKLDENLDELKTRYSVFIDEEVLAGIELTESKKSNDITLFAHKGFSGEPYMPRIDLKWFNLNN
jgi:hypothetical protein